MVTWLGFTPFKITHSSDYFQELYHLAVKVPIIKISEEIVKFIYFPKGGGGGGGVFLTSISWLFHSFGIIDSP